MSSDQVSRFYYHLGKQREQEHAKLILQECSQKNHQKSEYRNSIYNDKFLPQINCKEVTTDSETQETLLKVILDSNIPTIKASKTFMRQPRKCEH